MPCSPPARRVSAGSLLEGLACRGRLPRGVPRVHIINGHVDEGLLAEVSPTRDRHADLRHEYQQVRRRSKRMSATFSCSQELRRNRGAGEAYRGMIEKSINDYYIFEIDRNPVACVALHLYPNLARVNWLSLRRQLP